MATPRLSMMLKTFTAEDPGSWQPLFDVARAADAAGVDRVHVSDHVVFGEHLEAYARPERGGVVGGRQPTGPDGHWLEPLTTLSVICGMTTRVRLSTNILLAALRRPVVLAKAASTLDVLSGGRLDLGVGVGWQREEYEAAGLEWSSRGRTLDETLEVCQTLWREPRAAVDLPGLRFDAIHMMPKPLQPGGVPIWVSGRLNDRVVQRLARFGSGWIPWGEDAADLAASVPRMRAAVDEAGGDGAAMGVVGTLATVLADDGSIDVEATMASVPPLVAAGVTNVQGRFPVPAGEAAATEALAAVVAGFRRATE